MTDFSPALRRLTLDGPLSNALVDRVQAAITASPLDSRDIVLDAAGVTGLDPVAAGRLWLVCTRVDASRSIRIEGLGSDHTRRLRRHPLRAFLAHDEAVFEDPFASLAPSTR